MDAIAADLLKFATLSIAVFAFVEVLGAVFPNLGRWRLVVACLVGPTFGFLAHSAHYFIDHTDPIWLGYHKAGFMGFIGTLTAKAFNDLLYNPLKLRLKGDSNAPPPPPVG